MSRAIRGIERATVDDRVLKGPSVYAAAQGLVGTRFHLHGRDAVAGVDCVGLVVLAHARAGIILDHVPDHYTLRGMACPVIIKHLLAVGFVLRDGATRVGDVMFIACGHGQHHLALKGNDTYVHAHAGLRRVVETPGMPDDMIAAFHL